MNITYLLGNGFDLNIDMKTSYRDFYNKYLDTSSKNPLIQKFQENIDPDSDNWADLELGLGKYMEKIASVEDFDTIYDDICDNLLTYLKEEEESKLVIETLDNLVFSKDLVFPEKYLARADTLRLEKYKNQWGGRSWNVNIITFNYTTVIETMMGGDSNIRLHDHNGNNSTFLSKIYHIHGSVNDSILLGVNDTSQIHNDELKTDDDILTAIVKPKRNTELKELVDRESIDVIRNSQLIILFGMSLGDSDKFWWELIGNWLITNAPHAQLIIFWKGYSIPANQAYKRPRYEKETKKFFLDKTTLTPEQRDYVSDRIYIGYHTDIFNIRKKT